MYKEATRGLSGHGQRHNMEALSRVTSTAQAAQMCYMSTEVENNYAENIKGTHLILRFSKIKKEEQTSWWNCLEALLHTTVLSAGAEHGHEDRTVTPGQLHLGMVRRVFWTWGWTDISTSKGWGCTAKPWLAQGAPLPVSLCTQKQLHKSPPAH